MSAFDPVMGLLVPVVAILVPTVLAIWLARRERQAAIADRKADRADAANQAREERRQNALDVARATRSAIDVRG